MRNVTKEVWGLIALLVVFVVAALVIADPSTTKSRTVGAELEKDPSIYNDRASGSRGFFDWAQSLGYKADAYNQDWSHLPDNSTLLVCIAPESVQESDINEVEHTDERQQRLGAQDAVDVQQWLSSGRTLLLLTSNLPAVSLFGNDHDNGFGSDEDQTPKFADKIGMDAQATTYGNQQDFAPVAMSPLVAGVDSIHFSSGSSRLARPHHDAIVLFQSEDPRKRGLIYREPAAMMFSVGKGRIIAVADDYFADNSNITLADNAAFLANVMATSTHRGGRILFDEFHRGALGDGGATDLWSALGTPMRSATVQFILAFFILLGVTVPRFGSIVPLRRSVARTSAEYVVSLAELYRRAKATVPSLDTLYKQFVRDLQQRLGMSSDASSEALADAAARRGKLDKAALLSLLSFCESALNRQQLSEGQLLDVARQMERFKRKLDQ